MKRSGDVNLFVKLMQTFYVSNICTVKNSQDVQMCYVISIQINILYSFKNRLKVKKLFF